MLKKAVVVLLEKRRPLPIRKGKGEGCKGKSCQGRYKSIANIADELGYPDEQSWPEEVTCEEHWDEDDFDVSEADAAYAADSGGFQYEKECEETLDAPSQGEELQ